MDQRVEWLFIYPTYVGEGIIILIHFVCIPEYIFRFHPQRSSINSQHSTNRHVARPQSLYQLAMILSSTQQALALNKHPTLYTLSGFYKLPCFLTSSQILITSQLLTSCKPAIQQTPIYSKLEQHKAYLHTRQLSNQSDCPSRFH